MTAGGSRLRAHLQFAAQRLVLLGLTLSGDPVADWLRGSPRSDVYRVYERIRARGPVVRNRLGLYTVTSRELCDRVLRDNRFGVRRADGQPGFVGAAGADDTSELGSSFLELDPPDHTRLRRAVAPAFRPKIVRSWAPRLQQILDGLLDEAVAGPGRPIDLMQSVAGPFPIAVISAILGIPAADTARFAHIGALVGQSLDGVRSLAQADALRRAETDLEALLSRLLDERTVSPREDVLSVIAAARAEGTASVADAIATTELLLIAGFETTVNLIGNGVAALLGHPARWAELVAAPDSAPAVVEEILRWDPSVQATMRVAHTTVELGGTLVPQNGIVLVLMAAANRDPAAYPDPQLFDPSRSGQPDHLTFSSGIHYCLGAGLARLEGELVLRTLAERFPQMQLTGRARRRPGSIIRGFSRLPVVLYPRSAP